MVGFELGLSGYDRSRGMAFQRTALEAVRRLPGVTRAAFSNGVPLNINQSSSDVFPDTANAPAARGRPVVPYAVSPGFFETLEIAVRRGRVIDARDIVGAPRVAVVNETFARQIFGTPDAVGRHFRFGPKGAPIEVVGIVATGKYRSLTEDRQPAVFTSILQRYDSGTMLLVRASVPEDQMLAEMRRTLAQLDPGLPLHSAESLDHMLELPRLPNVVAAMALSAFGLIAVVLAATGIHGVVAYAVARRRREIGIRVAIGATSLDVLRLVVGRMVGLICIGAITGLGLAIMIGPLLKQIIYQVSPREPIVLVSVTVSVTLVGITACWVPALRSLRIEPLAALRTE